MGSVGFHTVTPVCYYITNEVCVANAALLQELNDSSVLSTPTRNYTKKVVKRSEHMQVRNVIIEEEHTKLKVTVTRRKAILSGKWKVIDGKHVLTTMEILNGVEDVEKKTKKQKTSGIKKGKQKAVQVITESNDEFEASEDESLVILNSIEVK